MLEFPEQITIAFRVSVSGFWMGEKGFWGAGEFFLLFIFPSPL